MKLNMKCALLCVCISLFTLQVQAQPASEGEPEKKKELPHEVPNPEKIAQQETDRLKDALKLSDKQYKKVYKLILKEQRELFEKRMQRPPLMAGGPGNGSFPPHEGMPPMGEGRPEGPGMGMHRPPMGGAPKPETAEDIQKRIEKKNKKMKKILTEAQYDQWLGISQKPGPKPEKKPEPKA